MLISNTSRFGFVSPPLGWERQHNISSVFLEFFINLFVATVVYSLLKNAAAVENILEKSIGFVVKEILVFFNNMIFKVKQNHWCDDLSPEKRERKPGISSYFYFRKQMNARDRLRQKFKLSRDALRLLVHAKPIKSLDL